MNYLPANTLVDVLCHCQSRLFEVVRFGDIGVFLDVVCGGVGMYNRLIKLDENEIAAFEQSGESALYDLAYEICKGLHRNREWTRKSA